MVCCDRSQPKSNCVLIATPTQEAAIQRIIHRCRAALAANGICQWDEVDLCRDVIAEAIIWGATYVLLANSECQATVSIDSIEPPEYGAVRWTTGEPALIVHRLCVDPAFQGRGLSHQLLNFVEAHAITHNYSSIRLDAYLGNPISMALYRQRGFREAAQICFPGRALPFVCFERAVLKKPSQVQMRFTDHRCNEQ
jgi:GNAT superfamily N-acetyltransferase